MKEEWLFPGAMVPVDMETTAALVAEIKRLIDVVGGLVLKQGPDYERGFVDGMSKQAQSSVDKAVNAIAQPAQEPDRQALQANGTHPAPCARHCEAQAFKVEIRNLKAQLAQPAQEPVYLVWFDEEMNRGWSETTKDHYEITDDEDRWLLYTAPPQRPLVGLTDEEIEKGREHAMRWAEAALKEKSA